MLSKEAVADLARSGLTSREIEVIPHKLGYALPYYSPDGSLIIDPVTNSPYVRVKLTSPKPDGPRYLSPRGSCPHLYFPTVQDDLSQDSGTPLIIVEGEKKAAAVNKALQEVGCQAFVVGIAGITLFTTAVELPDLLLRHRDVYVLLDSDTQYRSDLRRYLRRIVNHCLTAGAYPRECLLPIPKPKQTITAALADWEKRLRALPDAPHAEHVHPVQTIHDYDVREQLEKITRAKAPDEIPKVGADDFLVAGGDIELLLSTARGYTYIIPESRRAALDVAASCWCTVSDSKGVAIHPVMRDGTLDTKRKLYTSSADGEIGCQKVRTLRFNRKGEVETHLVQHYRWWKEHRDDSHIQYVNEFVPSPAARHGYINQWRGLSIRPIGEATAEDLARPFIAAHPGLFDTYGQPQVFPDAPRLVQFVANHIANTMVRRPDYAQRMFGSAVVRTSSVPAQVRWIIDLMIHNWLHPEMPVPVFLTLHGINGLGKTATTTGLLGAPLQNGGVQLIPPQHKDHAKWERMHESQLVVRDEMDKTFDHEMYSRLKDRATAEEIEVHIKNVSPFKARRYFYEALIFNEDGAVRNVVSPNDHRRRSFCFNDSYYTLYGDDTRAAVQALLGLDRSPEAVAFRAGAIGLLMTWGEEGWRPIVRDRGVVTAMDRSLTTSPPSNMPPLIQVIQKMLLADDNMTWGDPRMQGMSTSLDGDPGSLWDDKTYMVQGVWYRRIMAAAKQLRIRLDGVPNSYSGPDCFANYVNSMCNPGHVILEHRTYSSGKPHKNGEWRMVSKDRIMQAISGKPAPVAHYDVDWGKPGEEGYMEESV